MSHGKFSIQQLSLVALSRLSMRPDDAIAHISRHTNDVIIMTSRTKYRHVSPRHSLVKHLTTKLELFVHKTLLYGMQVAKARFIISSNVNRKHKDLPDTDT